MWLMNVESIVRGIFPRQGSEVRLRLQLVVSGRGVDYPSTGPFIAEHRAINQIAGEFDEITVFNYDSIHDPETGLLS